jgi:5-formyltetrahydrofolate cyclo-ligase
VDSTAEITSRKERVRAQVAAARQARAADQLTAARAAVRRHVLERVGGVRCVAAYVPLRTEPGSLELLAELHAGDRRVLVPLTRADRDLDWAEWTPDGTGAPLGVAAIAAAELVLVPASAVAADGTRLGRGGGSYDRALRRVAAGALVVALVFADELRDELPHEEHDVPVAAAVTPSGWVGLGGNADFPLSV